MTAFVALLRGVNVGKAKRVAMAAWREQLVALGYGEVATLLNSGNAVFVAGRGTPPQHAAAIAAALERGLGLDVSVVVKSRAELAAIAKENPYAGKAENHSRLLVAFTQEAAALAGLAPLARLAKPPEQFHVGRCAAYLHVPAGILQSAVASAMLGKAGKSATTRNWATTAKLLALLAEREA